jgi:predicted 3-demethylubiquinone-9 3-methyltransferase (glyoxalase superfamily)
MSFSKITTCLWFDGQAEEAAKFYTSIFPDSAITETQFYNRGGQEIHKHEAGTVLTVAFHLKGHPFVGLNGGPSFKFNESVSFQIECADQAEVDYYWDKLGDGGAEEKKVCGWVADKFGVSWQGSRPSIKASNEGLALTVTRLCRSSSCNT